LVVGVKGDEYDMAVSAGWVEGREGHIVSRARRYLRYSSGSIYRIVGVLPAECADDAAE